MIRLIGISKCTELWGRLQSTLMIPISQHIYDTLTLVLLGLYLYIRVNEIFKPNKIAHEINKIVCDRCSGYQIIEFSIFLTNTELMLVQRLRRWTTLIISMNERTNELMN